ncbi:MAG: SlyX family protein [Alphaproteobacteria bacterium]|nr:SlyX family protein [Alphaproteobacteria bacterium]
MQERLNNIEMCLSEQERTLEDLNTEVLRLSKIVTFLEKQIEQLKAEREETLVKPLSEETPPPHY